MMLTPASSPTSPVSDSSLTSRVKPLEAPPSAVTMAPQAGQVPIAQSLTEVSIHKTVIPPPRLSPPLCPVTLCRPPPVSPVSQAGLGHPREGQTASLLGGKYILLDELEGSTLHRCLDINSHEELVCKVSVNIMIILSVILTPCDLFGHMSAWL